MRAKKVFKDICYGLVNEVVVVICGFVIPRLVLTNFGSAYNGVVSAITQFLAITTILALGSVGATKAALYKPLADKDTVQVSIVVKSSDIFLRKMSAIFLFAVIIMAISYPFLVEENFDKLFTAGLVIIMSISTFAKTFLGQSYRTLLTADQRQGVISVVISIQILTGTLLSALLIHNGFGIRAVQIGIAATHVLATVFIIFYTKKKYSITTDVKRVDSAVTQRWDNFIHVVAGFISLNSGLVILSFFSGVYEVSVFAVYNLILMGLYGLFSKLHGSIIAAFGSMMAKGEDNLIEKNLRLFEQFSSVIGVTLIGIAIVTIIPFINIYTAGVYDANYIRPVFAYIVLLSMLQRFLSMPYGSLFYAAGHFKQTRIFAIIDIAATIVISIILVIPYGIIGIAVSSLVTSLFNNICFAWYTSRYLVPRSMGLFVKRQCLAIACILLIYSISVVLPLSPAGSYLQWAVNTSVLSVIMILIVSAQEYFIYKEDLIGFIRTVKSIPGKR